MTKMAIYGLPSDFKASFEIEGLIQHILGLPPVVRPIARIELEVSEDESHTIAKLDFTEHIHLAVLMGRTFGQVVFRGFPLTLVPAMPPLSEELGHAHVEDGEQSHDEKIAQHPHPYGLHPHHAVDPNAFMWNTPLTSTDDAHQLDNQHIKCSNASMEIDDSHPLQDGSGDHGEEDLPSKKESAPIRTGPVEFSLKATAPPVAPKTTLNLSSSSKLLPTSQLNAPSNARPAQAKVVARGGRHFINKPSDRPARATLPVHSSSDLPFTRGNICLLCRAQFASTEAIKLHVKDSSLHETQLSLLLQKHGISRADFELQSSNASTNPQQNLKKRQREPEDDSIDLDDELPSMAPSMAVDPPNTSSESTHSASSANVGMKMLQRMGYTGGSFGRAAPSPQ